MGKKLDATQSVLEYLIAIVFILGGITLAFAEPVTNASHILSLLGSTTAGIIYAVWFVIVGLALLAAKIKGVRKRHRNALMAAYLTSIFTVILEAALLGLTWFLLDGIILSLLAGIFWLRFKIQTEYLAPKDIAELRIKAKRLE